VIMIRTPSLREHKSDIPQLVEHFLQKHRFSSSSAPARISEDALAALDEYDWPGNVRELEHTIQRAVVLARGGAITREHLLLDDEREIAIVDLNQKLTNGVSLGDVVAEVETRMLQRALMRADGNRHAAARGLGIDLAILEKKLADYGLNGRAQGA